MTIEVTHRGRLPEEDPFAGSCNRCKTAIRCLRSDGTYRDGDQRDPGWLEVKCPTCGGTINAYAQREESTRWRDK